MVVNDEVNALVTMGFDPLRFLVVPRIIAAVVVVPLLTLYADAFAILGSLVVGVLGLDLTVYTYMQQIRITIDNYDVMTGFIKSLFFAFLVGGIGCHRGFQVRAAGICRQGHDIRRGVRDFPDHPGRFDFCDSTSLSRKEVKRRHDRTGNAGDRRRGIDRPL